MKKLIPLLFILSILFSLSGCAGKTDDSVIISESEEMEFDEIQWPDTDIAKMMPVPKSNIGNIIWSKDYGFVIYISETTMADYTAYVEDCESLGFTYECRKGDDYFYADNADGYRVAVTYENGDIMYIRIDQPKDDVDDNMTAGSEEEESKTIAEPIDVPSEDSENTTTRQEETEEVLEPSSATTTELKEESLYYSTNTFDQAKEGNSGVFSYKRSGTNYDSYWIIDFDEGYVYWFTYGNDNGTCDRVRIDEGDLNTFITVTYHDGDSAWQYGFCFKWVRQPDRLIQSEENGTQYEFIATDLGETLNLRDQMEIIDY